MSELRVTDEMERAAEMVLDPGDLNHAVEHEGYNPCDLAKAAVEAALQAGGFTREFQCRVPGGEWVGVNRSELGRLIPGSSVQSRLRSPWREVVSDGE